MKYINFLKKTIYVIFCEIFHLFYVKKKIFFEIDNNKKKYLEKIFNDGYVKINNYMPIKDAKYLKSFLEKKYSSQLKILENNLYKFGLRFENIQNIHPIANNFFNDNKIVNLVSSFQDNDKLLKASYQKSIFKKMSILKYNQNAIKGLGSRWHVDSWRHGLKLMLLLDKVDNNNGPMVILKNSNKLNCKKINFKKKIKQFVKTVGNFDSNHLYFYDSEIKNKQLIRLVGSPGDLFIIDTRSIHRASCIKHGSRSVLWAYYS